MKKLNLIIDFATLCKNINRGLDIISLLDNHYSVSKSYNLCFENIPNFHPDTDDSNWAKISSYYYYKKIPNNMHCDLNTLNLDKINKSVSIYTKAINDVPMKNNNNIMFVYKITDGETEKISASSYSLRNYIMDLIYYHHKKGTNELLKDMSKVTIMLLGIYKGATIKEINSIKKSFNPAANIDSDRNKMIIYLNDLVANQTTKQKCYFYKIYDCKFDDKPYIYFTYDSKTTIKNMIVHLDDKCINIKENNLRMDLLETCDVKTDIHSMLIADDYIDKYNSIENGYNRCYYFGNDYDKKRVFKYVQYYNMLSTYTDRQNYSKIGGYVWCIEHNKIKYIFSNYKKSIMQSMKELYYFGQYNNEKIISGQQSDINDILSTASFDQLKIYMLEKNIKKEKLYEAMMHYVVSFKSNVLNETNEKSKKKTNKKGKTKSNNTQNRRKMYAIANSIMKNKR